MLGTGVGMAAEYREHRKQERLSRENSHQDESTAIAGPSNGGPVEQSTSPSDQPPAYQDTANETFERSVSSEKSAAQHKKTALSQNDEDDGSSSSSDVDSVEDDEDDWELDEIVSHNGSSPDPPSYEEAERTAIPVDDLVRDVMTTSTSANPTSPQEQPFLRTPLPCPVIVPQRRPRKKARGFVRAYAPYSASAPA